MEILRKTKQILTCCFFRLCPHLFSMVINLGNSDALDLSKMYNVVTILTCPPPARNSQITATKTAQRRKKKLENTQDTLTISKNHTENTPPLFSRTTRTHTHQNRGSISLVFKTLKFRRKNSATIKSTASNA
jgi:hypothetical protein